MTTLQRVTQDIVDLHDFFTEWFNGTLERTEFEPRFVSRLHPEFCIISPGGQELAKDALCAALFEGYGANPAIRIAVRDVSVRAQQDNLVMATYTEWQTGSKHDGRENNARVSTVLMEMTSPILWRHVHETWLPEEIRAAGSYDF